MFDNGRYSLFGRLRNIWQTGKDNQKKSKRKKKEKQWQPFPSIVARLWFHSDVFILFFFRPVWSTDWLEMVWRAARVHRPLQRKKKNERKKEKKNERKRKIETETNKKKENEIKQDNKRHTRTHSMAGRKRQHHETNNKKKLGKKKN